MLVTVFVSHQGKQAAAKTTAVTVTRTTTNAQSEEAERACCGALRYATKRQQKQKQNNNACSSSVCKDIYACRRQTKRQVQRQQAVGGNHLAPTNEFNELEATLTLTCGNS